MPEIEKQRFVARNNVITGAAIAIAGLLALFLALDFDAESRMFPAVTSGFLAVAGIAIFVIAIVRPLESARVAHSIGIVSLACLVVAAWAAAFAGGAGFIMPTFIMQILLMRLTGIRRPAFLVGVAAMVTGLAYVVFVVLLNVPLPPSILPAVLEGF